MALVSEVCAWLAERGIEQWTSPPEPAVAQMLAREIAAGEVYLVRASEGRLVQGMLRFEWQDSELWPRANGSAGYVQTFMVRPANQGQACGAAMLRWAGEHVRARGRRYLRLDCMAGKAVLRRYYAGLGFRDCGVASAGSYTGALFERDLLAD
jgi:GNAT superfamily N-acetyltransferase